MHSDIAGGTVEVAVAGRWSWQVRIDLTAAVRKGLAERPRALVLDLSAVDDADGAIVGAVLLAERQCRAVVPPVPMAVVAGAGAGQRLSDAGIAARLAVGADPATARATLTATIPPLSRVELRLDAVPLAPSQARSFVGDTVLAWNLGHMLHPARLLISELSTNAVDHARTAFTVTASRRGDVLHLAVEDGDPMLPAFADGAAPDGAPLDVRGNGLRIVAATATSWGATPTAGGKVVWATLWTGASR